MEEQEEEERLRQIIRDGLRSMDIEVRLERLWMQSEVEARKAEMEARTNAMRAAKAEARAAKAEARAAAAEHAIRSCLVRERVFRDRCKELEDCRQRSYELEARLHMAEKFEAHALMRLERLQNRKRCRK